MTKNITMRTLMKVTMSMKTTMTTVEHRVLRSVWSCFPVTTVHLFVFRVFFGLYGDDASFAGLYDLALVFVVSPL